MFNFMPGEPKPRAEQKRLLIEKLSEIEGTSKLIYHIENDSMELALLKCDALKLNGWIRNKLVRL